MNRKRKVRIRELSEFKIRNLLWILETSESPITGPSPVSSMSLLFR